MEYCSSLWNTGYIGDIKLLERIQRRWTREVDGMEMCSYSERLLRLNLFSFQGRLLRNDMILIWKIINGLCSIPAAMLFSFYSAGNITRGHQYKMFLPRSNSEIRRRFFSVRVISRWNSPHLQTNSKFVYLRCHQRSANICFGWHSVTPKLGVTECLFY